MESNEFITNAVRTESKVDNFLTFKGTFLDALTIFICAGNILDMYKKNMFYGKEIDSNKMKEITSKISLMAKNLSDDIDVEVWPDDLNTRVNSRIFHALVGIMTESAELGEALDAYIIGRDIDLVNVFEEIGDLEWYKAILFDETGKDWGEVRDTVINKLKKRYPDKFTSENAINRDLQAERAILEGN